MTTALRNLFSFRREGEALPRKRYLLSGIAGLVAGLWVLGFVLFAADTVSTPSVLVAPPADGGIVVFTGAGGNRVWHGMDGLTRGAGVRLLISGVNRDIARSDVRELVDDPDGLFECCVDLDYEALNTWQNARETARWAASHDFETITLVTARFHEKRSILLLRHHLNGVEILSYHNTPLGADSEQIDLFSFTTLRILAWEYTKYEMALARVRFARLFGQ